uniref:Citrate transporter-like domain-containing protein n=1 Tax=Vitrella brassicaformis TaxID=1169539 RepID=A0A7S1KB52_9ALVE
MALSALGVELGWMRWFMAMSVPGVLDVALMPLVLYWAYPPEVRTTPEAPQLAREKLKEMGPLTRKEIIMIGTFVLLIFLWIFGDLFKFIDATSTAIVGVAILLLTGVLDVTQHIITEKAAYDTMLWFATLVMLAGNLTKGGFFDWLSGHVSPTMSKLPWLVAMIVLSLLFYFSHYAFASLTAHTASLFR